MKFPDSPRVKYDRNPIVEVICQLRFPKILRIETETPVNFQEAVRSEYPILNISRPIEFQINSSPTVFGQELSYEFTDKNGDWKLVLSSDFIALSTIKYKRWEEFRDRLGAAIDILVQNYSPAHFTRMGLRYQDIIVRSELELHDYSWRSLLNPSMLGIFTDDKLPEQDFLETLSFFACRLDYADATIRVRHGLARKNESEELGYLIDSDCYTEKLTEVKDVTNSLNLFNREIGNFFRWCISEELHQSLQPQPIK